MNTFFSKSEFKGMSYVVWRPSFRGHALMFEGHVLGMSYVFEYLAQAWFEVHVLV